MAIPFVPAIISAAKFVFTSQSFLASTIRFVGATLLSAALSQGKGPRLSDLKVQTSAYGVALPRLYGQRVRVAGNVIDKSDFIESSKKKGKILGIGGTRVYSYAVHLVVAICEGEQNADAVRRIWANGTLIFDRTRRTGSPSTVNGSGRRYTRALKTHSLFDTLTVYPGDGVQTVDEMTVELNPGSVLAYRHTAYIVIRNFQLKEFGNGVPNIEIEYEPRIKLLGNILADLASFAGADLVASVHLKLKTVRGYIVSSDGSVWSAIEPLSGVFAFDVIAYAERFAAVPRGRFLRTVIPDGELAARDTSGAKISIKNIERETPNDLPASVTVTYLDEDRDYQTNTQQYSRGDEFSRNKFNIEVPVVLTADEAVNVAARTALETVAAQTENTFYVSQVYRWLEAGDCVGLTIGGQIEPFRLTSVTKSPNGTIEIRGVFEDALAYESDFTGITGAFTPGELLIVGDTDFQLMDSQIVGTPDDDTGFYVAYNQIEAGWVGVDLFRAQGTGSPLTFAFVEESNITNVLADCDTTLPSGLIGGWDYVSTVTVTLTGRGTLTSTTQDEVEQNNANLAWVGPANGQGGEWINFATATFVSGSTYILSDLLRGRFGTEHNVGAHGSGERFVLADVDGPNRVDFGPADWNVTNTYKPVSFNDDIDTTAAYVFTNTGEGKKPRAPVQLTGTRNDTNNDILITWNRRTRLSAPPPGTGPAPLGEAGELYDVEIMSGATVVRTVTVTTPSYNYTAAEQTTDGFTPGAPVSVRVYQVSDIKGRGHVAANTV